MAAAISDEDDDDDNDADESKVARNDVYVIENALCNLRNALDKEANHQTFEDAESICIYICVCVCV